MLRRLVATLVILIVGILGFWAKYNVTDSLSVHPYDSLITPGPKEQTIDALIRAFKNDLRSTNLPQTCWKSDEESAVDDFNQKLAQATANLLWSSHAQTLSFSELEEIFRQGSDDLSLTLLDEQNGRLLATMQYVNCNNWNGSVDYYGGFFIYIFDRNGNFQKFDLLDTVLDMEWLGNGWAIISDRQFHHPSSGGLISGQTLTIDDSFAIKIAGKKRYKSISFYNRMYGYAEQSPDTEFDLISVDGRNEFILRIETPLEETDTPCTFRDDANYERHIGLSSTRYVREHNQYISTKERPAGHVYLAQDEFGNEYELTPWQDYCKHASSPLLQNSETLAPITGKNLDQLAELAVLQDTAESTVNIAFGPTGTFATVGGDDTIRLWDVTTLEEPVILHGQGKMVRIAFSHDGLRLASIGSRVQLWDPVTSEIQLEITDTPYFMTGAPGSSVWPQLAFSSDDRHLVVAGLIQYRVYDMLSGNLITQIDEQSACIYDIVYSSDGTILAGIGFEPGDNGCLSRRIPQDTIWFWDSISGELLQIIPGDRDSADTPIDNLLVSSNEHRLWLFDISQRESYAILNNEGTPLSLTGYGRDIAFNPDGTVLAKGGCMQGHYDSFFNDWNCLEAGIWLWDMANLNSLPKFLVGHTSTIESLAFSPAGTLLVSGDSHGEIRIWGVP